MRKDRRKKQQNTASKPLASLFCLALGVFFALAYALDWSGGFARIPDYLFGKGAFLLPLMLFVSSWQLFLSGKIHVFNKKTMVSVFVMLCLLGTAHHIFIPINDELNPSTLPNGGGVVGSLTALALHNIFGYTGTYVALFFLWVGVFFCFVPLNVFLDKSKNLWDNLKKIELFSSEKEVDYHKPISSTNKNVSVNTGINIKKVYYNDEFNAFTNDLPQKTFLHSIFKFKKFTGSEQNKLLEIKDTKDTKDTKDIITVDVERSSKKVKMVRPIINYADISVLTQQKNFSNMDVNNIQPNTKDISEHINKKIDISDIDTKVDNQVSNSFSISKFTNEINSENVNLTEQKDSLGEIRIFDSADKIVTKELVNKSDLPKDVEEGYRFPPLDLLNKPKITNPELYQEDIMEQCAVLEQTLADFRVKAKVVAVTRGPSVTRFELEPAPGVKVSSVVNLADDIALRLAAPGVRIEAPIPGKSAIGIEAPNIKNDTVCFREVVDNNVVRQDKSNLCIGLGKDISGNIIPADLSKMPHLLVAGSTGSGKSVCINTIITGILYKARPEDVKLILVDPKVVELSNYNGIPHLLTPVVTEPKKAASALHWAVAEMERRYKLFAESHVREINTYNKQAQEKIPFIVIIIDELSDLMMVAKVDVEDAILRLAQKARAAGIHLILATQRPSVDVITGIVKANIPSRIAFAVSSQTDSRTILDMGGAEKLLGKGDMLFYPIGANKPIRVQGAFVSDEELNKVVDFIVKQSIPVNYSEEVTQQQLECERKNADSDEHQSNSPYEDELFMDALNLVLDIGQASSSMLQRRFRIGYTRAARLVDTMEELGIIGQSVGSKPREVIMSRQDVESRFMKHE